MSKRKEQLRTKRHVCAGHKPEPSICYCSFYLYGEVCMQERVVPLVWLVMLPIIRDQSCCH